MPRPKAKVTKCNCSKFNRQVHIVVERSWVCLTASSQVHIVSVNDLPHEILKEIFTLIPDYISIVKCSYVCKKWYDIMTWDFYLKWLGDYQVSRLKKSHLHTQFWKAWDEEIGISPAQFRKNKVELLKSRIEEIYRLAEGTHLRCQQCRDLVKKSAFRYQSPEFEPEEPIPIHKWKDLVKLCSECWEKSHESKMKDLLRNVRWHRMKAILRAEGYESSDVKGAMDSSFVIDYVDFGELGEERDVIRRMRGREL